MLYNHHMMVVSDIDKVIISGGDGYYVGK